MKTLLLIISILLIGCKSKTNSYLIKTKNASGLKADDPIYINGNISGKIVSIDLAADYSVDIKINLYPDVKIPIKSSAQIAKRNALFSNIFIEITTSKNKELLAINDTIYASLAKITDDAESVKKLINTLYEIKKKQEISQEIEKLQKVIKPESNDSLQKKIHE